MVNVLPVNWAVELYFATAMSAECAFGMLLTCQPGGSSMATSSVC